MAQARVKVVLLFVLIFLLGAATGGIGYRLLEEKGFAPVPNRSATGDRGPRDHTAEVVDKFTRELGLTSQQGQQLYAIFKESEKKFEELHRSIRPQADAIRQESRNKIRALLTDQQKPKFEEMLRKLDEERHRREEAAQKK